MNLYEQKQFQKLEETIMRQQLTITELKFERDRRQKQLMEFMDITVELLEGLGWKENWILGYYQARKYRWNR